jgi:excisionase family DNA binding protein
MFSRKEAGELLGVSTQTIDRMIIAGELTTGRGKHLGAHITRDSIMALIPAPVLREAA